MDGPQHYREAERHLAWAKENPPDSAKDRAHLAAAQVHATLALAAATAIVHGRAGYMPRSDFNAWHAAASTKNQI